MNRLIPIVLALFVFNGQEQNATAFSAARLSSRHSLRNNLQLAVTRKTLVLERRVADTVESYDPLNLSSSSSSGRLAADSDVNNKKALWATSVALVPFVGMTESANAVESIISKEVHNPATFQPVCPSSDGFYRVLQTGIEAIVGKEKFIEYGPLIAGGLLRVRLELCVVESFFNEAVGPFIKENGVSWILPLHETVETFLAGSIFALATTFILVGSTKLLTVIVSCATRCA